MAAKDCSPDQPFVSELAETQAVIAEEGIHDDVGVKEEMVSDTMIVAEGTGIEGHEAVREQCGSSDTMETSVEGAVQTEVLEKELIPEVDELVAENEAADGVEGRGLCDLPEKSTEPTVETLESEIAKAEGTMDEQIEARGEKLNEDSSPNTALDAASDAKTEDEIVHDLIAEYKEANEMADGSREDESNTKPGIEVHGCMEVEGRGLCDLPAKSTESTVETLEYEIAKAEGTMDEPIKARGEELNEDSSPNTALDAASDAKTVDEIVHDFIAENKEANDTADGSLEDESNTKPGIEVLGCMEVEQRESMKDYDVEDAAKETVRAKVSEEEVTKPLEYQDEGNAEMYIETVPAVTVESKREEQQTEEGFEYDPDQDKENEPPAENDVSEQIQNVGIEPEHNIAVEDVGSEHIASDAPLTVDEAFGDYGAIEEMKDEREGAEPEEKLIVEDAANEITEAKETKRTADPTDGASNDYPVEYEIPTLEPEKPSAAGSKLSELVAMDQAAEAAEGEPMGTGTEHKEPEKTGEFSTPENASVSTERIVHEIDEAEQASRGKNEEGQKHDSANTKSTTIVMPSKEAANGKQSGKLMSRVKSSLGKVRRVIVGRSPRTKIIVVDARLQEKVQ